jgi:hypothetical protein
VYGIIFLELRRFLRLAHQHQDRGGTTEERVAAAFVGLPCGYEVREPLLEEILVDFNICHGDCPGVADYGDEMAGQKWRLKRDALV